MKITKLITKVRDIFFSMLLFEHLITWKKELCEYLKVHPLLQKELMMSYDEQVRALSLLWEVRF